MIVLISVILSKREMGLRREEKLKYDLCFALLTSSPLCGLNSGCFAEFEMAAFKLYPFGPVQRFYKCYAFSDMVIWDGFPYLEIWITLQKVCII